jgi:hypothetical protein
MIEEDKAEQREEAIANAKKKQEAMEKQLGELICARNPYPKDRMKAMQVFLDKAEADGTLEEFFIHMALVGGFESQIEEDYYQAGYWKFKDRSLRIAKAIRIPYIYVDENGNRVMEHVLVGYEGSGGP